jgi:hypothetical protein
VAIVSSSLALDRAQKDGRFWVTETHTDHVGVKYLVNYLASVGIDTSAVLTARATQIGNDLATAETAANIAQITALGSLASPTLIYSTAAALRTALRAAYQTATQVCAIMIGDYLASLTDAQLQAAFAMTAGQVVVLRAGRLTPAASAAATIRAAVGQ